MPCPACAAPGQGYQHTHVVGECELAYIQFPRKEKPAPETPPKKEEEPKKKDKDKS